MLGILTGDADAYVKGVDAASDDLDTAKIEELIQIRSAARKNKNWAEADRARNELQAMGILIEDGPAGTTWRRKDEKNTGPRHIPETSRKKNTGSGGIF